MVCITSFGAKGDGFADDSAAIQAALDMAGELSIPAGTYKIGSTLRVSSNTKIIASPKARIFLGDGVGNTRDDFLITNKSDTENIWIEGGVWDGNNQTNSRSEGVFSKGYTGVPLNFVGLDNLTLKNIVVRNPDAYFIRVGELRKFLFDGIEFEAPNLRPNQDGIHLGGFCEDGIIRNVFADGESTPNDDVIAFNADDALNRTVNQGMKCGPQRRIKVENISVRDAHTVIRMLSVDSIIEDIDIREVSGGCQVNFLNADAARYCLVPLFSEEDTKYANGVGCLKNISIKDVVAYKTRANDLPLFCMETRMQNFRVENFVRDVKSDVSFNSTTIHMAKIPCKDLLLEGIDIDEAAEILAKNLPLTAVTNKDCLRGNLDISHMLDLSCEKFSNLHMAGF